MVNGLCYRMLDRFLANVRFHISLYTIPCTLSVFYCYFVFRFVNQIIWQKGSYQYLRFVARSLVR